jgi:hypothetical protein
MTPCSTEPSEVKTNGQNKLLIKRAKISYASGRTGRFSNLFNCRTLAAAAAYQSQEKKLFEFRTNWLLFNGGRDVLSCSSSTASKGCRPSLHMRLDDGV